MLSFPTIAGYRITRRIGVGGMACVYGAIELALEREVAIKVVTLASDQSSEVLSRLEFEAKSLARLRHPHIVELYRFGTVDERSLYYVMPLLTAGDLSLWPKPVAEAKVSALAEDLLDALGFAHQIGIVHRDVKPENILFDQHGRAQLADFGAAFAMGESQASRLTREGYSVGSLGYMSPEQARGHGVSGASDLYALAVVCFELLTGHRPHIGEDAIAIALAQLESPPAALPKPLEHWRDFFAKALQASPHARFENAAQMKASLPLLPKLGTTPLANFGAKPAAQSQIERASISTTETRHLQTKPQRSRWIWMTCAIALAIGAFGLWLQHHARQQIQAFRALELRIQSSTIAQAQILLRRDADSLSKQHRAELAAGINQRMQDALAAQAGSADLATLATLWDQQLKFSQEFKLPAQSGSDSIAETLARRAEETLALSIEQFDRASAKSALMLSNSLMRDQTLRKELTALTQLAQKIPSIGETYVDPSGILMRLVQPPNGQGEGLAVMDQPLLSRDYLRLMKGKQVSIQNCAKGGTQTCIDSVQAAKIISALNSVDSAKFQLPTSAMWRQIGPYAPKFPSLFALGDTCRWVYVSAKRPNVIVRTWGGIRRALGANKNEALPTQRCDGLLNHALDGSQQQKVSAPNATVLVLAQTKLRLKR